MSLTLPPFAITLRATAIGAASLALTGCISLGSEPPDMMLTLTPASSASVGQATNGMQVNALLIEEPDAPQRLAVTRVPVQVDSSSIAYLKDAVWVERPSRLFRRLLAETVRAKSGRLVMERDDPAVAPHETLRGTLREFGYDAIRGDATVTFDAIRKRSDGTLETRRFSSSIANVAPLGADVGRALNLAANKVAEEVADWVG